MEEVWVGFKEIFKKYQSLFPPNKANKDIFYWSYQFVMTRCYGWSLPSTCLVPFADMMNHSCESTTHYIVNSLYEKRPQRKHK
jgi:hypothetical protein